jgi:RNA polymerase sigma factor (sigma-70 family)
MLLDMNETDLELLARYTGQQAEDAFAEVVRRHVDLVHSAALRQVRSPHLAEEVVQSTFIKLASHAHRLKSGTIVTAWLYQVTRREAIDVVRREARRQLREQIATEMNSINATDADWTHIQPMLDDAMQALDDTDRAAVLLRYFENKSLREVGQALGASDNAAQKRVNRAVDRLRQFLSKRGVTVGASGLVLVVSANAVQAAPAGLAQSVSLAAIAKGAVASVSTLTLIKGALTVMASKPLKLGIITLIFVLLAGVTVVTGLKIFRSVSASSTPNMEGPWEGTIALPNIVGVLGGEQGQTRVVLRFVKTNGAYSATGQFIDTAIDSFHATNITCHFPALRVDVGPDHYYEGTLSHDATEISGIVHAANVSLPLTVKRTTTPSSVPKPLTAPEYAPRAGSELQGRWEGFLGNGPDAIRVVVKISEPSSNNFHAELDNLNGPWLGQRLLVTRDERKVQLLVASHAGMFQGTLNEDGSQMAGNWVQGGRKTPSKLRRTDR